MNLAPYLQSFAHLHVNKNAKHWNATTTFRAPHKPLLLLSILDLFAQGRIRVNLLEITPEVGDLFAGYWEKVIPAGHQGNMALPFFHMCSSPFWRLVPKPGQELELSKISQVNTLNYLDRLVLGAKLDEDLYILLHSQEARSALRSILIDTYFAPEMKNVLHAQSIENLETFQYGQHLLESYRRDKGDESERVEPKPLIRDRGFRQAIMHLYSHRCAFCGVRMMTPDGHSVVEAAHIVPWSITHNDDPRNGMALCKLCHWTFDEGLTSLSSLYQVLLSTELRTSLNMAGHLLALEKRVIIGPSEQDLWPERQALNWHRENVFRDKN